MKERKKKIISICAAIAGGAGVFTALFLIAGEVIGFRYKMVTKHNADGTCSQVLCRRW